MNNPRMLPIFLKFSLFISGMIVAYLMIGTPDREFLRQIVSEEHNKLISDQGMRGNSDLEKKIAQLESNMEVILNASQQGLNTSISEPSLTLSLLGKINELEEKMLLLSDNRINNNNVENNTISAEKVNDILNSQTDDTYITQHYQNLENNYQTEEADPQWSLAVNDKIKNSLEDIRQESENSASIIGMDCKSTMCRIEMTYDEKDDMGMLGISLVSSLSDEIGEYSSKLVKDSDGQTSSIIYYLSRKGYSVAGSQQELE